MYEARLKCDICKYDRAYTVLAPDQKRFEEKLASALKANEVDKNHTHPVIKTTKRVNL